MKLKKLHNNFLYIKVNIFRSSSPFLTYMLELVKKQTRCERRQKTGTKEWADSNVNICYGCKNNCRYCYAKKMAIRFGRENSDSWKSMRLNQNAIKKKYIKRSGVVMFPSTHDIVPEILDSCLIVLKKLLESGNNVLITTKPVLSCVKSICEHFFEFQNQILFRFTIGSSKNELLIFWEPYAPMFQERLMALKYAFNAGFATSVSIEPFLDYDPVPLVEKLYPYVTNTIWLGKMNYIKRTGLSESTELNYNRIRLNYTYENISLIHQKLSYKEKIRWKDSIRDILDLK